MDFDFRCDPIVAWLNVNQQCNMRCRWCYAEQTQYSPEKEMSFSLAKDVIEICLKLGVSEFVLIGGEPTLWPHLFNTIQYIKERGARVSIITNGMQFSNDGFWAEYIKNPASSVGLSIKSMSRSKFFDSTRVTSFDKMIKGVSRVIKHHKCGVSAVHNELVGVSGTVEIAKRCKELGATSFQLVMCTPTFNTDGNICTDYSIPLNRVWDELKEISINLESLYGKKAYYDMQLPLCLFPKEFVQDKLRDRRIQTQCHLFSRTGINFDTDGNIILCNTISERVASIGKDFCNEKDLIRYLNSKEIRHSYQELARYPSKKCKECIWREECRGGCLMNWFTNDPDQICHPVHK